MDGDLAMHGAEGSGTRVSLALPDDWFILDLDPKTRHRAIAAAIEERLGTSNDPDVVKVRGQLVARLRRAARDAENAGAILCACLAELDEDSALSASLLVAESRIEGSGAAGLEQLREEVATLGNAELGGMQVEVVDLAVSGRAVRAIGLGELTERDAGASLVGLVLQYFIPAPASQRTVVLTFSTPSMQYAEELEKLFDAIASTCIVEGAELAEPTGAD